MCVRRQQRTGRRGTGTHRRPVSSPKTFGSVPLSWLSNKYTNLRRPGQHARCRGSDNPVGDTTPVPRTLTASCRASRTSRGWCRSAGSGTSPCSCNTTLTTMQPPTCCESQSDTNKKQPHAIEHLHDIGQRTQRLRNGATQHIGTQVHAAEAVIAQVAPSLHVAIKQSINVAGSHLNAHSDPSAAGMVPMN